MSLRPSPKRSRHSSQRLFIGVLCVLGLVLGACGIPTDDAPIAFQPEQPTPVDEATPTPIPDDTQLFPIYLIDNEGRVQQALRSLPLPLTITALVTELTEEPTEEESERLLVSLIPPETEFFSDPFSADGLAELDFVAGTSIDTLEGGQLTAALAQFVWTLTGSPSIEGVIIRIDGEDQSWPTDAADKATALRRADYDTFDPEFVEPTPTADAVPPSEDPPSEEEPTPVEETPDGGG